MTYAPGKQRPPPGEGGVGFRGFTGDDKQATFLFFNETKRE